MVTGDHPLTAEAIARKVNIITRPTRRDVALEDGVDDSEVLLSDPRVEAVVITGSQIGSLEQADWDAILSKREVVFARTSPQQKLKLVENYQRRGEVRACVMGIAARVRVLTFRLARHSASAGGGRHRRRSQRLTRAQAR